MNILAKLFNAARAADKVETVSAPMVPAVSLDTDADEALQLAEEELESTKHALEVTDQEATRLARQLNEAEEMVVYLNSCGQRPVVPANQEIEDKISELVLRVRIRCQVPSQETICEQYRQRLLTERTFRR